MSERNACIHDIQARRRVAAWNADSTQSESDNSRELSMNEVGLGQSDSFTTSASSTYRNPLASVTTAASPDGSATGAVLRKLVWTDLVEQTRMKLVRELDQQLDEALIDLVTRVEEREKNLYGFQWHMDYMKDK
ncbi:unnamed protein product [Echinostoma caproni]|uniref:BMERB domain-containing protein n=1 Tax=Echinostoma caproni TaxID=27848 RepID=A0A183ARG9_9TREM|nr:unnamed protein product [Echinostoma caproni]